MTKAGEAPTRELCGVLLLAAAAAWGCEASAGRPLQSHRHPRLL